MRSKPDYLLSCILFFVIFSLTFPAHAIETCRYKISSGHISLSSYGIAKQICSNASEIICPMETNGSLDNLYQLLNTESVIGALVQSDIMISAAKKKNKKIESLKIVIPVKREMAHLIVKADSAFHSFKDLGDAVICTGKRSSGSYFTALHVKAKTHSQWIIAEEDFTNGLQLLDRNSVDAVFTLSAPPIADLAGKIGAKYRLIEVPPVQGYKTARINQYENQEKTLPSVSTIAVDILLLVLKEKIRPDTRLANKLSMGIAGVIQNLPPQLKDEVCTNHFCEFGIDRSFLNREACKLGYFGQDW